jgi:HK97 family phage portal protein
MRFRRGASLELEAARPRIRLPVVRSGTPLEVAEVAWLTEGVGREAALTIPAVAACRAAIVGTIVQLPAYAYRGDERLDPGYMLTKPDPSTTWTATIAGTIDDLLFHGRAYWRVLERDSEGFPRRARWTPHRDVTPETRSTGGSYSTLTGYRVAGVEGELAVDDLIRFDGQAPGVLETGARTLAAALELEEAARRLASIELPAGVLKNEGTELSEDEAAAVVASFEATRLEHGVAFVQGLEYQRENLNAADLQLIEARHNVSTEVARLFSVPVAMIGASPSGNSSALLYSNLSQQLAILVSSACAPHLKVVETTLSDVVPRGQSVAFDVQSFLRGDPQAAADYALGLLAAGVIDVAETRSMLGIPSSSGTPPDLTPGRL